MKGLYKYPLGAYPYDWLVEENQRRDRCLLGSTNSAPRRHRSRRLEFELLDTGVFKEDRYFDVFVEYAKAMSTG